MRVVNAASKCLRKVRHPDRAAAVFAANDTDRRMGFDTRCEPYFCHTCGGWHVGHAEPRDMKAAFQGVSRRKRDAERTRR